MTVKQKIKILLKEADLYHKQGLLSETKKKYNEILELIQHYFDAEDSANIKKNITARIQHIEKEIEKVEKKVMSPDMTTSSQDLITKMFVIGEDENKESAILEGAKALMKFGQFKRAISELEKLLTEDAVKSEAARQIINCYILESRYDDALKQYQKWLNHNLFSKKQLDTLGQYIKRVLTKRGIEAKLHEGIIAEDVSEPDIIEQLQETVVDDSLKDENDTPGKSKSFFFEEEEFEEFDIMASIQKSREKVDD